MPPPMISQTIMSTLSVDNLGDLLPINWAADLLEHGRLIYDAGLGQPFHPTIAAMG